MNEIGWSCCKKHPTWECLVYPDWQTIVASYVIKIPPLGMLPSTQTLLLCYSTYKIDCPSFVVFRISDNKQFLEIRKIILLHEGHPDSKAFYKYLPEVRRLTSDQRTIAQEALELRCHKKKLQLKLIDEYDKFVTLEDLSNIQAALRHKDDLAEAITLLKQKGATPKIFAEDDKLKAIYFSTADMRKSMSAWPEILFIDGTYKLLKSNMTVMTLLVEDSNASTEIVGVALLVREDYKTFKWFLETFKSENTSACSQMNCMMGDKDLLERDVLKEVFPNVPIYICLFHTLRTFSREINTNKMNISKSQRVECLKILEKLAYSSSAQEYDENYIKLCERAPERVLAYFNKNWHVIKNEWTVYSISSGNLHNLTNNRTESANTKIKVFVPKRSTLMDFIHDFFSYLQSHKHQVNLKTSKSFTRRKVTDFSSGSYELDYINYLTREASMYVLTEIEKHQKIVIINNDGEKCLIKCNDITIHVTDNESSCECITWTSSLLPCRHIFAVRKFFGAPLFSKSLCDTRWTKEYCKTTQRSFRPATENNEEPISDVPFITRISSKETSTMKERQKNLGSSLKELIYVASLSCGSRFYDKEIDKPSCVNSLEYSDIRNGQEVHQEIEERLRVLRLDSIHNRSSLSRIEAPIDIVVRGHPRQSLDIYIRFATGKTPKKSPMTSMSSNDVNKNIHESLPNDNLSGIKMPTSVRSRGRPRGSKVTVIGLPRHRHTSVGSPIRDKLLESRH